MPEYILLMHDDANDGDDDWGPYPKTLKDSGHLEGGSAIGNGTCVRKTGAAAALSYRLYPVKRG